MQGKLTQAPDRAKEIASARPLGPAEERELARIRGEFPELAWAGEALLCVPRPSLLAASNMVYFGEAPQSEAVARTLGISVQDAQVRALAQDVKRRARRPAGTIPVGKPLDERRRHVAVRILLEFAVRLFGQRPRFGNGDALDVAAAAVLAQAGLVEAPGHEGIELHPRARKRQVRLLEPAQQQRVEAELSALERREFGPGESVTPLPDQVCGATRRNHRRVAEARAQYQLEKHYARQQKLERLAGSARFNNPAGIKPLPLHAGRKARDVAWDRDSALKFLGSIPPALRVRLFVAATRGGTRGRMSREARLVYAFYAYLMFQAEAPRPAMRSDGFDRAVEGLSREALAVAFAWNEVTQEPYHANTVSKLAGELEEAGLLVRETPNSKDDVYTGVTGWALYVYRFRNAMQLTELLRVLEAAMPTPLGVRIAPAGAATAPS
jgi:hypothetical protein